MGLNIVCGEFGVGVEGVGGVGVVKCYFGWLGVGSEFLW